MLYFSIQNASPRWDEEGLRGGGCEMTISCSDHGRIVVESSFYWRKQFTYVTRINHEMHFAWQAQYLVKLECYFSCQAQHLVKF